MREVESVSVEFDAWAEPDCEPHRRPMERVLGAYLRSVRIGDNTADSMERSFMRFWQKLEDGDSAYRRRFFDVQARKIGQSEDDQCYLVDCFRDFLRDQILVTAEVDEQRAGYFMPLVTYFPRFSRIGQIDDALEASLKTRIEERPRDPLTMADFIQVMLRVNGADFMQASMRSQYEGIAHRLESLQPGEETFFSRDAWTFLRMLERLAPVVLCKMGFSGRLRQVNSSNDNNSTHEFKLGIGNSGWSSFSFPQDYLPSGLYEQARRIEVTRK